MRQTMRALSICVALFVLLTPMVTLAKPTINCHCFRDRSFDAQKPHAADDYFLATAQNSFFASRFDISKKSVVIKKQKGMTAEELWLTYWLAEKGGITVDQLLFRRDNDESWRSIVDQLALDETILGRPFSDAIRIDVAQAASTEDVPFHLDQLIVDQILVEQGLYSTEVLQRLRQGGATNKMVLLLLAISEQSAHNAESLYAQVVTDGRSWGELVNQSQLNVKQLFEQFKRLLNK